LVIVVDSISFQLPISQLPISVVLHKLDKTDLLAEAGARESRHECQVTVQMVQLEVVRQAALLLGVRGNEMKAALVTDRRDLLPQNCQHEAWG